MIVAYDQEPTLYMGSGLILNLRCLKGEAKILHVVVSTILCCGYHGIRPLSHKTRHKSCTVLLLYGQIRIGMKLAGYDP